VLKKKFKELEMRCRVLSVENEALKVEVEMYREEAALSATAKSDSSSQPISFVENHSDHFVQAGNGVYAQEKEISLGNLNGSMNISCCSLSSDDTILATGGADQDLTLCLWGGAFSGKNVVQEAIHVPCEAPVISVDFSRKKRQPFVAAGCMDGSVRVLKYDTNEGLQAKEVGKGTIRHERYVRNVVWASHDNLLATSSAAGDVQVHKVIWNGWDDNVKLEKVETLHLSGPVEALCIHRENVVCYARGSPYLLYFDLQENFKQSKINLNQGQTGHAKGFNQHVSFAIMDIAAHGDYLALATDTSRNIIMEFETGKQVRNLYG
jgi:WD40 repeat protein